MGKFAWVTLATNDSYSLGALVVASSLKKVNTAHELAVLVTPGVSESMKTKLRSVFNLVEEVNVLDSQDAAHLALLKRPELGITFTKLHCWRLTQYEKCVFLDADTLILQNSDELFEREELSAAPDVGWPDCFNSGVFVYRPSLDTFGKLVEFATTKGSFDGGDQGLLNSYFNDWATKDITKRLPFTYNTTTTAVYSYIPAFKQFGDNLKILHFIGQVKPWLIHFDPQSKTVSPPPGYQHITKYLQLWWTTFCEDIHPNLSPEMNNTLSSFGSTERDGGENTPWHYKPNSFLYIPPSFELLSNPKHNNYNPVNELNYYDPWEKYDDNDASASQNATDTIDKRDDNDNYPENVIYNNNNNTNTNVYEEIHSNSQISRDILTEPRNTSIPYDNNTNNNIVIVATPNTTSIHPPSTQISSNQKLHFDEFNNNKISNGHTSLAHDNDINVNKNKKNDAMEVSDPLLPVSQDDKNSTNNESGIAGALAKLTLGVSRSPEQEVFESHMRRQCWESGNIDYLGKDSFDNIWRRITQTIESGPKQDIPAPPEPAPREPTPLPEEKLKVDIPRKEVTLAALDETEDEGSNSHDRNVIAVCSPHELMRSLSSPGLAHEEIITTVLPNGKTVQQKILTFPEREIVIEDYEHIEILGPITRKITTETTRIVPGKEDQKEIVVRTEIHNPENTATTEKQQTITQNTLTAPQSQQQLTETNQNVTIKPKNSPKILITDVLKPIIDGKVEFDPIHNTTTVTRKTPTGSEMMIATVTPDGRNRVQTKTFFDPIVIHGTEEEEEVYTEEQTIVEGKTITTTTTQMPSCKPVASKPTDGQNTNVEISPSINVETRDIVHNGRKGVEKTITETTKEGKITIKKIITYEGVEEEEIIEETETHVTDGNQVTLTSKKSNPEDQPKPSEDQIETKIIKTQDVKVTEENTSSVIENTTTTVNPENGEKTTITIEKTPTGHKEITTITTVDGLTRSQTKTFYDPVEIPGDVEEIEEYEETTTTEPNVTTKTTTTTSTVPPSNAKPSNDPQTKTTSDETVVSEETRSTVVTGEQAEITEETHTTTVTGVATNVKTITENVEVTEPVVTTKTTTTVNTLPTSKPDGDQIETKIVETEVTEQKTTSTTAITDKITTTVNPDNGEITTVTIEKTPTGHKEITTITTVEGLTRSQTKTFYDPVEIPGEEEEIEEYEETTTTKPTVTTTTTTSTVPPSIAKPSTDLQTKTTSDETIVSEETHNTVVTGEQTEITEETHTTTVTGVATNVKTITENVEITEPVVTTKTTTTVATLPTSKPGDSQIETKIVETEVTEVKTTNTTAVTDKITTTVNPDNGEITTVTIEKTPTGHKEITTITTVEGLTRSQTKTFYDPVEIPGEEEEIEEYEETTTTEPVVTTKTTTTTTVAKPSETPPQNVKTIDKTDSTHVSTQEITEQTSVRTTSTNIASVQALVEDKLTTTKVDSLPNPKTEIISTILTTTNPKESGTSTVEVTEETITEESITSTSKVPNQEVTTIKKTPVTSEVNKLDTTKTTTEVITGGQTNVKTVQENTIVSTENQTKSKVLQSTAEPSKPKKDPKPIVPAVSKDTSNNLATQTVGQISITTKTSEEITEIYQETGKNAPVETTKITDKTTKVPASKPTKPVKTPDTTKSTTAINKKNDTSKTTSTETATTTNTKQENIVAKTTVGEEKTTVTIEKTATGHKEITTIVSADGETRIRTKTFYDPVEQEEEEIEEYEETHTTEPVVTTKTTTKKAPSTGKSDVKATEKATTKVVTETETTKETLKTKTPKVDDKKTAIQKVDKKTGAVTVIGEEKETTTTKTKTTTTDTSKTLLKEKTDKSTTTSDKTKTLKDSKISSTDTEKKTGTSKIATDKSKTTTNKLQQATPQGEPKQIVTTKRVENGTEHTITTIFPDGTKKIETKTFFDAVEVSGDEEEEEIEEYEEIEEPTVTKTTTTTTKQPSKSVPAPAPAPAADEPVKRKKISAPEPQGDPKPSKEDSQFQPSKLKIPAAFASANPQTSGPVRPLLRKTAPKATDAAGASNGVSSAKDAPVPPPRKKEVGKLFTTSMLLLLLISLALIYNQCVKRKS